MNNLKDKRHSVFSTYSNINQDFTKLNQSDNMRRDSKNSKIKLRSNSIFAFQGNDLFSNLCDGLNDGESHFSELNSVGNISNFLSNFGDIYVKNNFIQDEKKEGDSSDCSIDSELEKNLDSLVVLHSVEDENEEKIDFDFKKESNINNILHDEKRQNENSYSDSEKYDQVQEFSEKNEPMTAKRLSGGSTHYSSNSFLERLVKVKLNNLCNLNNYENDNNRSNTSLQSSASHQSSFSPEVSSSPSNRRMSSNPATFLSPLSKFRPIPKTIQNEFYLTLNPNNKLHPHSNQNLNKYQNQNFFIQNNDSSPSPMKAFQNPHNNSLNNSNLTHQIVNKQFGNIQNQINLNQIKQNYTTLNSPNNLSFGSISNMSKLPNTNMPNLYNQHMNKSFNNLLVNLPNFLQDDKYVLENTLTLIRDQNGCRMVQQKLKEKSNDLEYIYRFYENIQHSLVNIINDQFGNYVIQKFFEIVQRDKFIITKLFDNINENLFHISLNHYGTRFFQRALESFAQNYIILENKSLNGILRNLVEKHMLDLILDANGNHVLQKVMLMYPKNKNQFIFDQLACYSFKIAKLKQGGCIFGRAFECASPDQTRQLVFEILNKFNDLINDEYGNFIIQQIVFMKNAEFNDIIFHCMKENLGPLSKRKFSSNVIDKCILFDDPANKNKLRNDIIDYLLENKLIGELICDQFGNYVVQKALQVSDGIKFMSIVHDIKISTKNLKQTSYGRKTYENLLMQYGDCFQQNNSKHNNLIEGRRNSHK